MTRIIVASILAFGLAAAVPALAESPASTDTKSQVEQTEADYKPLVRQSTQERWQGGPRLRAAQSDELLRAQALDIALPVTTHGFAGGSMVGGL